MSALHPASRDLVLWEHTFVCLHSQGRLYALLEGATHWREPWRLPVERGEREVHTAVWSQASRKLSIGGI